MSTITHARSAFLPSAATSPTSKDLLGLQAGLEVEWASRLLLGVTFALGLTAGFLWELGSAFGLRGLKSGYPAAITNAHAADLTMALVGILLAVSVGAFLRLRGNRHRIATIGVLALLTLAATANIVASLT